MVTQFKDDLGLQLLSLKMTLVYGDSN